MFKKNNSGFPGCFDNLGEWNKKLNSMIKAFRLIIKEDSVVLGKNEKIVNKGLDDFREYFQALWT